MRFDATGHIKAISRTPCISNAAHQHIVTIIIIGDSIRAQGDRAQGDWAQGDRAQGDRAHGDRACTSVSQYMTVLSKWDLSKVYSNNATC